jgi:outer membrane autotransporter protein
LATEVPTINVLGNYTQNAGGTLQLRVAGANVGQYDSLNVRGNALVGGTLQLLSVGFAPVAGNQLGLVTTGGTVSGRFARFVDPFVVGPGFNTIDLVYGLNSVVLKFLNTTEPISPVVPIVPTVPIVPPVPPVPPAPVVVSTIDFQSFALNGTINEKAAASLLNRVELDPAAAGVIGFMLKQPTGNYLADFNKISPDVLSSLYEIGFSDSNILRLTLEDRLDAVRNGSNGFSSNMNLAAPKVYLEQDGSVDDGKADKNPVQSVMQPSPENRWGVWVSGFGDFVHVDGDGNGKGYDFTTGGVTVGIDLRITDNLVVGLMGDYSHTWSNLKPGHLEVNSGRGGLYASWFERGFYLDGAIYGGGNSINTARSGLAGLASGGTDGSEWSAFLSGGYDFHVGRLTVGPIAAIQYTEVNIDGFSEHGSVAPMAIHGGSAESLRSDFGFRAFYQWQVGKFIIEPSLKATWEHEYKYSALPITAGFAGVPGPSGTFYGPSEGHNSAVVDAGVTVQWTPTLSTYLNYDGQLGRDRYGSNAVTGGISVGF